MQSKFQAGVVMILNDNYIHSEFSRKH